MIETLPDPSPDNRRDQTFMIVVDATSAEGERIRGIVEGSDTYGTAAGIAVECAARLVDSPAKSRVLAPSEAFEPSEFLDRLAAHDVRWRIEDEF
jgi:hypothetical protein